MSTFTVHPSPQLTLRPLFFEVPSTDNQTSFSGRHWLMRDMDKALESSSSGLYCILMLEQNFEQIGGGMLKVLSISGVLITGSPGTGKTAFILQLVEYSCFGRKRNYEYEELREQCDIREVLPEEITAGMLTQLASNVVAYHFCQVRILQ